MPLLLSALALPAAVTVNLPAMRLETGLPAIGQAAGVKMEASAALAQEVLLVRAENVTLESLLVKIAEATAGEWQFDGTTYRLIPNVALRNADLRAEIAERVAAIQKSLQDVINPPPPKKGTPEGDAAAAYAEANPGEAPDFGIGGSSKTLAKIVALIGAPTIANLPPGGRVVFADRPNGVQRQLPGAAAGLIAQYVKEHNESASFMPSEADMPDSPEIPEFVRKMMESRSRPIKNPAKVILAIGASPLMGSSARLVFYAQDGSIMNQGDFAFAVGGTSMRAAALRAVMGASTEDKAKKTPIVYSEETKTIKEQIGFSGIESAMQTQMKLPPALQAKLFRPDEHDPLSFAPSEEVVAFAKSKGKPVVASIPDTALSIFGMQTSLEDLATMWRAGEGMKLTEKDGWLVLRPEKPVENRNTLVMRPDLARLMGTVLAKGYPSLDDIAAYSLRNPSVMDNGVSQVYLSSFVPGMAVANPFQSPWEAYQLFGGMNPVQKAALRRGEPVPLGQLAGPALTKILFGSLTQFTEEGAPEKDPMSMAMDMVMGSKGADNEPTEVMPNGIPTAGYLTAQVREEPFAAPASEGLQ
ncbi:hypothetical protein EON79_08450, partial [bacterium]